MWPLPGLQTIRSGRGPVSRTLASLQLLGLGADVWQWQLPHALGVWKVDQRARRDSVALLVDRWRRSQWVVLAQRRKDFRDMQGGADW